jgi:hypothetical protein
MSNIFIIRIAEREEIFLHEVYLKKQRLKTWLGMQLKWQSTCLANVRL